MCIGLDHSLTYMATHLLHSVQPLLSNSALHLTETWHLDTEEPQVTCLCLQIYILVVSIPSFYIFLFRLNPQINYACFCTLNKSVTPNNNTTLEEELSTMQILSHFKFFIFRPKFNIEQPKYTYQSQLTSYKGLWFLVWNSWGSNVTHNAQKSNLDPNKTYQWEHTLWCHGELPQSRICHDVSWRTAPNCWNASL